MKLRIDKTDVIELDEQIQNRKADVFITEPQSFSGEQNINEPSELGEAIRELNNDTLGSETRMSGIDLRSRLHPIEITSILAVDTLVSFKFLPETTLPFTRQKKRLSVSQYGRGRDDIVKIVAGKRELEEKTGGGSIISGIGKMFGGGNNE